MERAVPVLPVSDLQVARDFYVDRLGFQIRFEASPDGRTGLLGVQRSPSPSIARWMAMGVTPARRSKWREPMLDPFGNTLFVSGPA